MAVSNQELANVFCKGPDGKSLGFAEAIWSLLHLLHSANVAIDNMGTTREEAGFHKTLFTKSNRQLAIDS